MSHALMRASLTLAVLLAALSARAWTVDTQAGCTYSDNLSRTSFRPDRQTGTTVEASATAWTSRQLARDWLLTASAEAGASWVPRFAKLDSNEAGLHLLLRRKFGLGPLAPVAEIATTQTYTAVKERGRSGWKSEAEFALRQRLTQTLRLSATGGWSEYFASHPSFDVRDHHAALEAAWDFAEDWQLTAGVQRRWGELTANAESDIWWAAMGGGFGPRVADYYHRIPWEVSNTFGDGWVAYRVDCHADFSWLQLAYTCTHRTVLSIRGEQVRVINAAGVRYDTNLWSLNCTHRF